MEPLVSTRTLGEIDEKAMQDFAIPSLLLMEHAGVKGFHRIIESSGRIGIPDGSLVIIAGSGNNGGDALVMAREAYLEGKTQISVLLIGSHISKSSAVHRQIISRLAVPVHQVTYSEETLDSESLSIIAGADVIIDGILGTGLHSKVNEATSALIHAINESKERGAFVISVDVPSGYSDHLPATLAHVQADLTVTFGLRKYGSYHPAYRSSWGDLAVVNPSFPPDLLKKAEVSAYLATLRDARFNRFSETDYKNRRGHLALFGGSENYSGAVQLSAYAAFASGAGLISLFLDEEVASHIRRDHPSFIVHTAVPGTLFQRDSIAEKDVIVCGPGWGKGREEQLLSLLKTGLPTVLDADAIRAFGSLLAEKKIQPDQMPPLILTPHPGEMRALLELMNMPLAAQDTGNGGTPESFLDSLSSVARVLHAVLVYKSHVVWIADGRSEDTVPTVVDGKNNALGVAGSGDILTGIIGALVAGGNDLYDAALTGVLLHQRAGEKAREEHRWFDSTRLIEYVASAYAEIEA